MKRILPVLLFALGLVAQAQVRYGTIHYDSLLTSMPGYEHAQDRMAELRRQYADEAAYNEMAFKRQFAEFLQGQQKFSQSILLKRQRDLQDSMEKGIAYRAAADSLLRHAEADLLAPLHSMLNAAILDVGLERGYELIVNLDERSFPFLHPQVTEDATPYVLKKLQGNISPEALACPDATGAGKAR